MLGSSLTLLALALAPAPTDDTSDWIRDHAFAVRPAALDDGPDGVPADDDFADLAALADRLENVRLVLLGEPSYGDGAAFLAKGRLIRYLHQRLGFDVLAWQSGLLDCEQMQARLDDDATRTDSAASFGVYRVWGASAQVLPVFEYARSTRGGDAPLRMCGFDCVVSARGGEALPQEILNRLPRDGEPLLTRDEEQAFREAHRRLFQPPYVAVGSQVERDQAAIARVTAMLEDPTAIERLDLDLARAAVLRQALGNLAAESRMRVRMQDPATVLDAQNLRQRRMAENLLWILNERFPDRRVVAWCPNQDLLRDLRAIETGKEDFDFSRFETFADPVFEALGDAAYSVAFTAIGGVAGVVAAAPTPLADAPEGSLEARCGAAFPDAAQVLLDLRSSRGDPEAPDASPLLAPRAARPIGYEPVTASWPRHVDALFVIREMTPSTFRKDS